MTIETHIDSARERVHGERDDVQRKVTATERFVSRVRELTPEPSASASSQPVALSSGGTRLSGASGQPESGCSRVRTAFADTVYPHAVEKESDESVLRTIQAELSDSVAVAVAPTTDASLTEDVKAAIVDEARVRAGELRALDDALEREREQLATAAETVADATDWIVAVNDTPLSELGFESLQERHETLAEYRRQCDRLVGSRQAFLDGTTSRDAQVGITHRSLIEYLYDAVPVAYPVLATVVRLDGVCRDCQRAVRDHLVRRV